MFHEKSCGAIVFRRFHGNIQILLIKHINSGHWSFPKGHIENNETETETAVREIKEETGILIAVNEILEDKRVRHIESFVKQHPEAMKITSGAHPILTK